MSDYTISKPIEMFGKERAFRALSGQVIKASQRSDTYVTGSGSGSSVYGHGNSSVSIGSSVVVTSDIWIRGQSGQEYHLRLGDIPAREGNILHIVDIVTPQIAETKSYFDEKQGKIVTVKSVKENVPFSDEPVLIYNSGTGEWYYQKIKSNAIRNFSTKPIFFKTWLWVLVIAIILFPFLDYDSRNERSVTLGLAAGVLSGVFGGPVIAAIAWLWSNRSSRRDNDPETFSEIGKYFEKFKIYADLDEVAKHFSSFETSVENGNQKPTGQFCTQCGKIVGENIRFCGNCGTQLATQASS